MKDFNHTVPNLSSLAGTLAKIEILKAAVRLSLVLVSVSKYARRGHDPLSFAGCCPPLL